MEGGKERRGGGLKDNYIDFKELGVELLESRARNSKKHRVTIWQLVIEIYLQTPELWSKKHCIMF